IARLSRRTVLNLAQSSIGSSFAANTDGKAASNRFHMHIRHRAASPLEAILLVQPRTVTIDELSIAMSKGRKVLSRVAPLGGEYLIKGTTGLARRDWGAALSNLWIVAEQILSALWEEKVVSPTHALDQSRTRRDQLNDTRTWTAAARIELLYQTGVLTSDAV